MGKLQSIEFGGYLVESWKCRPGVELSARVVDVKVGTVDSGGDGDGGGAGLRERRHAADAGGYLNDTRIVFL